MVMLLPILPFLAIPCVQAKPGNNTSVNISANSIKLEPANRRILYSGKVRLRHKSLTISQNSGSGEVTITGKPVVAKFVDSSGKVIQLKSQSLAYDSITRSLFASGNVELQSGDDRLSGQKMQYDMANDRFSIEGDQSQPRISAVVKISEKQTK